RQSARRRAGAQRGAAGGASTEGSRAAATALNGRAGGRSRPQVAAHSIRQRQGGPRGSSLPAGGGAGRWCAGRSGGGSVESAPRPQGRPRPVVDRTVACLAEQLDEIAAGAAAPEDMLEPALAAVLEASHASAGAL